MEKLVKLIQHCKGSVHILVNEHKDSYVTVEQHFNSNPILEEYIEDIDADVFEKMKQLDTMIELHFYPDSPVGFYKIYHYDLSLAIDKAFEILKL